MKLLNFPRQVQNFTDFLKEISPIPTRAFTCLFLISLFGCAFFATKILIFCMEDSINYYYYASEFFHKLANILQKLIS